jgi:hypothetical protein
MILLTTLGAKKILPFGVYQESGAAAGPDLAPSKTVKSEEPSPPIEKEPSSAKAMARQPLSPYIL